VDGDGEVSLDLDVLGAMYLGGADAFAYAAADRIRGNAQEVARLHDLFHTARAPWCNQVF
jgi:predicted acetyltransferase